MGGASPPRQSRQRLARSQTRLTRIRRPGARSSGVSSSCENRSLPSRIGRSSPSEDLARRIASVQAAINKELHRIGAGGRVRDLFPTQSGKYRCSTNPTMSAEQLAQHHDGVIRATRTADPSVTGLEAKTAWL